MKSNDIETFVSNMEEPKFHIFHKWDFGIIENHIFGLRTIKYSCEVPGCEIKKIKNLKK